MFRMSNGSLTASNAAQGARPDARTAAVVVAMLSALLTIGAAALAVAHAGLQIPGLSALGPGGDRAVVPAAVAFSVATVLAGLVTFGSFRRRPWAWALGLVVHAIVLVGAAVPYRGLGSLIGILISAAAVAVLVSRPGRTAFLPRRADR